MDERRMTFNGRKEDDISVTNWINPNNPGAGLMFQPRKKMDLRGRGVYFFKR